MYMSFQLGAQAIKIVLVKEVHGDAWAEKQGIPGKAEPKNGKDMEEVVAQLNVEVSRSSERSQALQNTMNFIIGN